MTNLESVVREEWPRVLAAVLRFTRDPALAEDAVAEAVARLIEQRDRAALRQPGAWLTTVAKRIALDTLRRDAAFRERMPQLLPDEQEADPLEASLGDDRLALVVVACSPAIGPETRLALALRFALGLGTPEIADALLVTTPAMNARLTRAKRRIAGDGLRFDAPDEHELDARIPAVLQVVHVMYTLGHSAPRGSTLRDTGLAAAAIELARALHRRRPTPEAAGLLALLLFTEARATGEVVTLEHADRGAWDHDLITEAELLAIPALAGGGRFALEAGIAGCHALSPSWQQTPWPSILALYDRLVEVWPSPAARIARVVALSYVDGPVVALAELDRLEEADGAAKRAALATRADLLRRVGHPDAAAAFEAARDAEQNEAVRAYLRRRADESTG